ncbi:MAG TPA: hypothetical protein VGY75_09790 [Candidatus Udaeobacter sp.]|jgi:hypothetical protein|nr:hypothetical protein [Candidatus Udaeobacter sp.]
MTGSHERFLGARVLVTFAFAVIAQMVITLVTILFGWSAILVGFPLFFAYMFFFGRAFLHALRRTAVLRNTTLRFATPILCSISLLFCSFSLGAYIGATLNSTVFHMPVEDFDR